MRAEKRRSLAKWARYLMRPNFSRDGLDLNRVATILEIEPSELDLILWRTNCGQTQEEYDRAHKDERPVEHPMHRGERGHLSSYDPKRADAVLRRFG